MPRANGSTDHVYGTNGVYSRPDGRSDRVDTRSDFEPHVCGDNVRAHSARAHDCCPHWGFFYTDAPSANAKCLNTRSHSCGTIVFSDVISDNITIIVTIIISNNITIIISDVFSDNITILVSDAIANHHVLDGY